MNFFRRLFGIKQKRLPLTDSSSSILIHFEEVAGKLFSQLSDSKNLVFSPASIYIALAMAAAGAGGNTLKEFLSLLGGEGIEQLLQETKKLEESLVCEAKGLKIVIANRVFNRQSSAKIEFTELIAKYFEGGFKQVDFDQRPDQAREEINTWVSEHTKSLINDLIPARLINSSTRMVIVNAIYFKGDWLHKFNKILTRKRPFLLAYGEKGKKTEAMMMCTVGLFNYSEYKRNQFIQLQYEGDQYAMEILLPRSITNLDKCNVVQQLNKAREKMKKQEVKIELPRFKITSDSISLKDILINLGLVSAFSDSADFSGLDSDNLTNISDVIHKAMIEVNEDGAEASAATAVIGQTKGVFSGSKIEQMTCNSPFIYSIRHVPSSTTLFIGKITSTDSS